METMKALLAFFFAFVWYNVPGQVKWPSDLVLTPEKSDFTKTSTYADVMQFIAHISTQSDFIHVLSMGKSPEGKEIPVAVLSNPKVTSPEEARRSGKPVVYIQGNIHAGEVEGKEVIMMLMRDVLLGDKTFLLDHQIILFTPIYNTDSNDKMEKGIRPSQEDSPPEVGLRENSQGLDLNRDGIKLAAHETLALFGNIINRWDPQVFVDIHTTNGTWHAYSLTWAPSYHYAGEYSPHGYTVNMLRSITQKIKEKYNLLLAPYGDYDLKEGWPVKNYYAYNHRPRYLVNQFSLRNRIAILSEAFAHERFYQRIHSTYTFVYEILEYINAHAEEILSVNRQAEEATIRNVVEQAGRAKKGVRFKMIAAEKLNNFITYDHILSEDPDGTSRWVRIGKISSYDSVNYHGAFEPIKESIVPRGYVFPAKLNHIAEHLTKLGITVKQLEKAQTFSGEIFMVENLEKSTHNFQGHFLATATGKFIPAKRSFKKGDYIVDLAQRLANLAFYVLEPESDDGLLTWNFFDNYFKENKSVEYPVFKYFR